MIAWRTGPLPVAAARIAASAAALAAGFRAVSDDDFARVVIAEQWARAPRLDPSGTSWLPFPFWIAGAAMKVGGRSLDTARMTAALLGVGASLLVYLAARWLGETRGAATAGAAAAALFPWSARLGVATVPELFTAALTVLAMAALSPAADKRQRLLGGAALLAATLSRYEAWPVALLFAAVSTADAARSREDLGSLLGAAGLALAGPAAWMAWNRAAHGDALHFWARVTGYRQALGESGYAGARIWDYAAAMVREEPEIVALLASAAAALAIARGLPALREHISLYARPAAVAAAQVAALSLAMIKDGAPTHHPERAVLSALILVALAGGALAVHAVQAAKLGAVALVGAVALAVWLGRAGRPREGLVHRTGEVAIGRVAGSTAKPGEPVLIEVADYGYLAVTAAMGRPEDAVPDRTVDPRDAKVPSSFASAPAIRQRMAAAGARWVAARNEDPVREALGAPVEERDGWGLYRAAEAP